MRRSRWRRRPRSLQRGALSPGLRGCSRPRPFPRRRPLSRRTGGASTRGAPLKTWERTPRTSARPRRSRRSRRPSSRRRSPRPTRRTRRSAPLLPRRCARLRRSKPRSRRRPPAPWWQPLLGPWARAWRPPTRARGGGIDRRSSSVCARRPRLAGGTGLAMQRWRRRPRRTPRLSCTPRPPLPTPRKAAWKACYAPRFGADTSFCRWRGSVLVAARVAGWLEPAGWRLRGGRVQCCKLTLCSTNIYFRIGRAHVTVARRRSPCLVCKAQCVLRTVLPSLLLKDCRPRI
mmetsp:Transcript_10081/g.41811  ORF Transcript_10081/g.41811 Transcript_10081/m.41811 type:complete len:288 (-) Transcript_10081:1013-1876(-)